MSLEKKPAVPARYLVLKNPTWEEYEEVVAHSPQAAAKQVAGSDKGTYLAVAARYVKIIEVDDAPPPPEPQMALTEQDTADFLRRVSGHAEPDPLDEDVVATGGALVGDPA